MLFSNGFARARLWSSPSLARYCLVAGFLTLIVSSLILFRYPPESLRRVTSAYTSGRPTQPTTQDYDRLSSGSPSDTLHPIDRLIAEARRTYDALLLDRSKDVATAAVHYRKRRGRHPPPGFDKWMAYATKHDAVIVEDFFDRIYQDIAPFWALDPKTTAARAASWHHVVRVRNGKAEGVGETEGRVPWLQLWTKLVGDMAKWLPDVDMPINYMDEPRLLVPWEDINSYVAKEQERRKITPIAATVNEYTGLSEIDAAREKDGGGAPYDPPWNKDLRQYWEFARKACAPTSPSHDLPTPDDYRFPPTFPYDWRPEFSYQGYVKNFTASTDPCTQPHLRYMHGSFVEPLSMSTATELIPLFGGSKLPMNNEMLIPGAMYITDDPMYSGGKGHGPPWEQKKDGIIYRGVGSGGRHKAENWSHFQRHRLIEALNGTTVSNMERNGGRAMTFELAPLEKYDFPRRRERTMGRFLTGFANCGFTNLLCFPRENCTYAEPYFREVENIPMEDQYVYKFIPDADGNSFSARYRGLLLSTSLPMKATVYAEWHDARLLPWLHFVPLDNTFQDIHAILDYFTRDGKGDAAARLIAETGKSWGERVLRHEDMVLYTWRLLLEFARVCDEKRESLGYIDDLR